MEHSLWKFYTTVLNGIKRKKEVVTHPYKKIIWDVLSIMYKKGYISCFRINPKKKKELEIYLKYTFGKSSLKRLFIVSKPSNRIYFSVRTLWKLKSSLCTYVLSTSKGVLSDEECRKYNLGGELLCIVI